tara:strand:- start:519 stop:758 length:240 start_codon:yes stop_codon:yes gene_type:complete
LASQCPFEPRRSERNHARNAVLETVETTDVKAAGNSEASETTDETTGVKAAGNSEASEMTAEVPSNRAPTTGPAPVAAT